MDDDRDLPRVTAGDTWSYTLEDGPSHTGAQGQVYFGRRVDGTEVAVKVAGDGGASTQNLLTEIGSLRALEAAGVQGVVPVLDVVDVDGRAAMVMPRYDGTLLDWLQRILEDPGPDTLDEVLRNTATIARILAGVHGVQWGGDALLHRDVKPENLFLDARDRIVLGDFGGAMAISGLQAVELALFGSPMYAPLDQILPGRAIPDPTWDTYALCVILYMALTGARPAYQSDPRSLLTTRGSELWALAQQAIHATGGESQRLRLAFAQGRVGTTAADLIDPVGKSALNTYDRQLLMDRTAEHARRAGAPDDNVRRIQQGVWQILTRGLSPVSHPSPPNRYREAAVLAEQIEDLRDLLHRAPTPAPPPPAPPPPPEDPPRRRRRVGLVVPLTVGAAVLLLAAAAAAVVVRYPPDTWFAADRTADIPARTVSLTVEAAPADPTELAGADALAVASELPEPQGVTRVGARLPAAARDVVLLAVGADGAPVRRLELGPRPPGEHLLAWSPPESGVRLEVRVDPAGVAAEPLVEGRIEVVDGVPHLGGAPLDPAAILAWTGSARVPAFRIDRTEVSEARWKACAQAGACAAHEVTDTSLPVTGVTFDEASAFCAHAGGFLPTEAQWRSAHGPTRYPWGDARPTCRHAHGAGCAETVQAVGLLPEGASAEGVMDLAGNAWEWVRGGTGDGEPLLVGGSVETRGGTLGATARLRARGRTALAGLRCAYAPNTPSER